MVFFSIVSSILLILFTWYSPKFFEKKKTKNFKIACEKIEPSIEELCHCLRKIIEKSSILGKSKKSDAVKKSDTEILSKIYFEILQEKLKNGEKVSQRMIQVIRSDLEF